MGDGPIRVSFDDLEWPLKAGHEGQIFQAALLNNTRTVWHRMTKFRRIKCDGEVYFYRGSQTPLPQGASPSAPQFLVFPSIYACTFWPRTTNIWRGNTVTHIGRGLVLSGQPLPTPNPKGRGPRASQFWGVLFYLYVTLCRRTTNLTW